MPTQINEVPFCGEDILRSPFKYQCQWQWDTSRPTKNQNGIMGFAKILWSTNTSIPNGETKRFHLCANNPCAVVWPSGKYGVHGPPIHLQQIDEPPELAAFAEPPPAPPLALPPTPSTAPPPPPCHQSLCHHQSLCQQSLCQHLPCHHLLCHHFMRHLQLVIPH